MCFKNGNVSRQDLAKANTILNKKPPHKWDGNEIIL
jgi:hypothetical protein